MADESSQSGTHAHSELDAELAQQLDGLGLAMPKDPWRVERVIKESPSEVTQLVWLRLADGGELGPFVRKRIRLDASEGGAWRELARAEHDGARFLHLPRVVSCEERDGLLDVVMEHVSGPTLRELEAKTPENERPALAARVVPGICAAVAELHEGLGQAIVHRDVTPSNVICSGRAHDLPVLVDLGIARTWKAGSESDTTHFGTRAYAAPEQFGFGQTDARTDVYALGLVAFFCLTGRDTTAEDRERGYATPGVSEAWRQVIVRACAFDPEERYQSAHELAEAVARIGGSSGGRRASGKDQAKTWLPALRRVWEARNLVVVPVALFFVAINVACFVDPPQQGVLEPPWLHAYAYLVYLNCLVVALGYLLMDKRWLRRHVRWLREHTLGQTVVPLVLALAIMTAVFLFGAAFGA